MRWTGIAGNNIENATGRRSADVSHVLGDSHGVNLYVDL
jgi:hypothetical protein